MGLSIISTTSASLSLAASPVATELAEGLPGEFASLLSGQTFAALISRSGIGNGTGSDSRESRPGDAPNENAETGSPLTPNMDPAALVAMLGNPQLQPEAPPRADAPAEEPWAAAPTGIIRASNDQLGNLTKAETAATAPKNPSVYEQSTKALPEPGNAPSAIGLVAEKAAIIAAEHPENTSEASPFAAGLSAATQQRGVTPDVQSTIAKPTHTDTWPQQFGEKIVWMARNDQQTAQININPPQLGPVQITLNLSGDNATVLFASPHAEVRQIIESSMPQLREMLASAGISLGESNVGANMAQQNPNNPFMMANKNQSTHENAILPANDAVPTASSGQVQKAGRGLVDLFA